MYFTTILFALATASSVAATGVVGTASGFAAGVTGGGNAPLLMPRDIHELQAWLEDSLPRNIIIDREYNFIGSMGRVIETGCRPASNTCPGRGGQDAINGANWCNNGLSGSSQRVQVNYDKAGVVPINLKGNKSLIGKGANAVIRGKGLRIANGATNVIIQNIHITELNPQYIWGGDAITAAGTDLLWIDHCKFSLIGRQMFVAGYAPSNRVTISNNEFDGRTPWSASCDNRHYWVMLLLGGNDQITFEGNYIHHTSGRGPKIGGNTVFHAVNNLWSKVDHAFELHQGGKVLAEGNVFVNVATPIQTATDPGQLYAAPNQQFTTRCRGQLRRDCRMNSAQDSGSIIGTNTNLLSDFSRGNYAVGTIPSWKVANKVKKHAGVGKCA